MSPEIYKWEKIWSGSSLFNASEEHFDDCHNCRSLQLRKLSILSLADSWQLNQS